MMLRDDRGFTSRTQSSDDNPRPPIEGEVWARTMESHCRRDAFPSLPCPLPQRGEGKELKTAELLSPKSPVLSVALPRPAHLFRAGTSLAPALRVAVRSAAGVNRRWSAPAGRSLRS